MKKILGVRFDFFLVVVLFLLFSLLYSLLSVVRHNHFQSQGIDFSIYDQALWLYSQFEKPYSTITFQIDLADRFRPVMIPLSVLFWFSQNERTILIFQAIILAAAALPIWLLARRRLPRVLALLSAFLYLDFIGVQSVVVADFHEMAILPFFLSWLFYFLDRQKWLAYFVALTLALSVREHVGFLLATLGIYIWFFSKNAKIALATTLISVSWSIMAIFILMPALGQAYYASFVRGDDTLGEAILSYVTNPTLAVKSFFWPLSKIWTLFWSFFSFGFLPLFYIALAPTILFQFTSRFLDLQHPIRWTLFYHYSAELAVLLTVATTYSLGSILQKFGRDRKVIINLIGFLIIAHLATNIILDSPLKNLLKPPFWRQQPWMADTNLILSKVPRDASLQTQNNLLPHLSHRKEVYLLPIIRGAEYVVFDLHPGQNDWNFYTDNLEIAKAQFKQLVVEDKYKPIISAGDAYLLKRQY